MIQQLADVSAGRILCTSLGRAQLALAAARQLPGASVHCHYLDLYQAQQAVESLEERPANLTIACAADFPEGQFDLVALPLAAHGEAELTRNLMQEGYQLLAVGGRMLLSTDNPEDTWLHGQMNRLFGEVLRRAADGGAIYSGCKRQGLKKVKNFAAEFVFRDRDRLIRAVSRPGVFSHRRIDPGARQLLNAMEVTPGSRVLDLGCGSGVLSLAAAGRAPAVEVCAVDCNARAVQCTQQGAQLNGLTNIRTVLSAAGDVEGPGMFDLVLGNPPYYADFRIAELFAQAGHTALRPGGRMLLVTKSPEWYRENMPHWFDEVQVEQSKDYHVVRAVQAG